MTGDFSSRNCRSIRIYSEMSRHPDSIPEMVESKTLWWGEVPGQAPESPAIYAWYLKHNFSSATIETLLDRIEAAPSNKQRVALLGGFLKENLILPLSPHPYQVDLRGSLLPRYRGSVEYEATLDQSAIQRLVDDPSRLKSFLLAMRGLSPDFTAPLYIGISNDLRRRLSEHHRSITAENVDTFLSIDEQLDSSVASFAGEIRNRKIKETDLFVKFISFDTGHADPRDLEYLINRIVYPLFGRK